MAGFARDGVDISFEVTGKGPPVLFLHGFPQTRALWHDVVDGLRDRFTCVTADLRGYGASAKPDAATRETYSFREMARDMTALMSHLGHARFHIIGHDRGGRVAHRMALDAPERLLSLTVLDIVPTRHLWETWERDVATAYWHWTLLAQPAPFPERLIEADADAFFETCLLGWGGAEAAAFKQIDAYRLGWRDPDTIRGMVADYRAAADVDLDHDRVDADRRVAVPSLVAWGADSVMGRLYDVAATWEPYMSDFRAATVPGGHFFIDTAPVETTRLLDDFLAGIEG